MRMIYALNVGDYGGNNERHEFLPTITRGGPVSPPTVAVICTAAVTLTINLFPFFFFFFLPSSLPRDPKETKDLR